jgi:hypothetical protein
VKGVSGLAVKQRATRTETIKKVCLKCNKSKELNSKFYTTASDLYVDGKYPVCKECMTDKLPPSDPKSLLYLEASINVLAELNKPYIHEVWLSSIDETAKTNKDLFGTYIKNLNLNTKYKFLTYTDSEKTISNNSTPARIEEKVDEIVADFEFTEEDLRSQKDCIRLIGYDPFAGYTKYDQKFLYAELIPYLDEDTLEDQYKISVIIQLLNNNSQIRKIDLMINKLSSDDKSLLSNTAEIKNLASIKNAIATSNDKLSKENAIAIKHRGDKKAGRSTLGYLMKDLRELNFEDAEEDYYDMKKAYGMQLTADISHKSILSQLNFDEKDIEDMFKEQRDIITDLQQQKEELEEKLRQANINLKKVKKNGDSQ